MPPTLQTWASRCCTHSKSLPPSGRAATPRGAAEPTADLSVESAAEDCRAATLAVAARTDRSDRELPVKGTALRSSYAI